MDALSNSIVIVIAVFLGIAIVLGCCRACTKSVDTQTAVDDNGRTLSANAQHPIVQIREVGGGVASTQLFQHANEPPPDFSVVVPYPIGDDPPPAYDDVVNNRVPVNSQGPDDVTLNFT